jgi:RNA polymerase sigma-70 factor, ECF subfamily
MFEVPMNPFCVDAVELTVEVGVERTAGVAEPSHRRSEPGGSQEDSALAGNQPGHRRVPRAVEETSVPVPIGAEAAFSRYVIPEVDVLYRVARSITRHDADAEDLVQDTMLRAFRGIERFDGRHPRAWLLTIMRNAQINRVRRRRPVLLADPEEAADRSAAMIDETAGPEQQVVERGFDAVVEDAYVALPEKFREVIDLVDLAGLSYEDAATVLEVPQGTVMSRLHRGRKRIREALADPEAKRGARP